jgi:hypothetical protein
MYQELERLRAENEALRAQIQTPYQDQVNNMLQGYSEVLSKIHGSVRTLGGRLEEIEKNKSKRYRQMKRKL